MFISRGYDMLAAMRAESLAKGFGVTLPNDHPLDMENPDLRKRADSIFADLKKIMLDTTVVIADLEAYRVQNRTAERFMSWEWHMPKEPGVMAIPEINALWYGKTRNIH